MGIYKIKYHIWPKMDDKCQVMGEAQDSGELNITCLWV